MQRIGVLEFVEQQVPVARIQLQRQGRRVLLAGEQAAGQPFGIGEIDRPLLRLGVLIALQQRVAEQQAVAVEVPDADVGLDRGDGFECGFQRVEVAQVAVEFGAERLFQLAGSLLLAARAGGHQARHEAGMGAFRIQSRASQDVRRALALGFRAFFQRVAHPLHPRQHELVGPEGRHRIGRQIGMQAGPQLFQRIRYRVGLAVGIGPPFRPRLQEMRKQGVQVVLADVGEQGEQRGAFR